MNPEFEGMGTTLVTAFVDGRSLLSIGDSPFSEWIIVLS